MGKEQRILSPSSCDFILAQVYLPSWFIEAADSQINIEPSGATVYLGYKGAICFCKDNSIACKELKISKEEKKTNENEKVYSNYSECTVFWVHSKRTIDIPFGDKDEGIYGVLRCEIGDSIDMFEQLQRKSEAYPYAWKFDKVTCEGVGSITFQYLMEYFVDDKSIDGKQKGLSIELRDSLKGYIFKFLSGKVTLEQANNLLEDPNNDSAKNLKDAVQAWGLNTCGFVKLGQKQNNEGEQH